MQLSRFRHRIGPVIVATLVCAALSAFDAGATTFVRFDTVMGAFDVELYEDATPATVANFLNYVTDGDYVDSFFHRSAPGFVVQGGGFTYVDDQTGVQPVPGDPPVVNEPGISNTRGTVAMAKLGGDPDGATNQWFVNLADNASNLDNQNGGFTVFGEIRGGGMAVVDDIAALQIINAGSPFDSLPVIDFTPPTIFKANLVIVNSATALLEGDANNDGAVTADDLIAVQQSFGDTGAASGDLSGDATDEGTVTADDLIAVQQNFGSIIAGGGSAPAAPPVPEPATAVLLAVGFAIRRRTSRI